MKVLTIREPFATLIKDKVKYIETRSWNTKYRGELYIHAAISKDKIREELKPLIKSKLMYGYIICKVNLVDVVCMNQEFIDKEKKKNYNNYISGRYEVGRYAWILDNVEVLNSQIKAKGQLGLWNYKK